MHGINDLVRFLGGTGDIEDESEIVAADSFARYQTYFQDRQNVLAHESEKLQEYELLTQRRSMEVYDTVRRANTFLIAWGSVFLTATLVLSILSAFGVVDWKAAAVTGGLSLAQFVGAFFTQPSSDLQRNLTNLAVFKMVLESHSLKTAVARFHLTTPQALRELHSETDAEPRHARSRRCGRSWRRSRTSTAPTSRRSAGSASGRTEATCQRRPPPPRTEPLPRPAPTARPRRRASRSRSRRSPNDDPVARHFGGSDRANATPRSTQVASWRPRGRTRCPRASSPASHDRASRRAAPTSPRRDDPTPRDRRAA